MPSHDQQPAQPWWKFGYVWLVISGPAIVVVASFVTLYFAIRYPETVIDENYYRNGMEINQTLNNPAASLAPAMQGRNHAQTGVIVAPTQP
ncbi:MAG: FixH family protein [Burkholderiaceae bacterium]